MPNRILVPLIIATALFMENLDATVIATALPAIAIDFNTSPIDLKLAITSYLLSIAVFIPASGWVADRFGARLVFRLAILIFVTGSIMCGMSGSILELTAARVLQGIGGAMMVPVGRLVLLRSVDKSELVNSLAWLTVPALVGPLMGPPVGGFLTTFVGWRWIFWINVPVGVLGLVLATLYIPDIRGETRRPFDLPGFLLSGGGLAFFMTGATLTGLGFVSSFMVQALMVTGAILLVGYFTTYRHRPSPIIDLGLIRIPTFAISLLGSLLFRIGIGATPFLIPLMLQLGFGMSPFHSGLIAMSGAFGAVIMKFIAMPMLRRWGYKQVLVANTLLASAFVAMPAVFTPQTPVVVMVMILLFGGLFRSLQFTSVNSLAFADVSNARMSSATTLTSVGQQLALTLGITVGALIVDTVSAGGDIGASDFWIAFVAVGSISALGLIPILMLKRHAGHQLSGHQPAPDLVTSMRERG